MVEAMTQGPFVIRYSSSDGEVRAAFDRTGGDARAAIVSDVRNFAWSNFREPPLVKIFRRMTFFPRGLSQNFVFLFDPIEKFL